MATLEILEQEIEDIKKRNRRVEADKAWETSWTRRFVVSILTYFVIVLFFWIAELPKPFTNSIVPALAFVLSTATIPAVRKAWQKYIHKEF